MNSETANFFAFFYQHVLTWIVAIPLALGGIFIARSVKKTLIHHLPFTNGDNTIRMFLANAAYVVLLLIVTIIVLGQLGIPTATLITIIGAGGLAVGLALQGTLSNVAAGLFLIFLRPFKVGDYIQTNGAIGTVTELNIFTTTLLTTNNDLIFIPNAKIISDNILNHTAYQTRRIELFFPLAHTADLPHAKQVILDCIQNDKTILNDPAPECRVTEHTAQALMLSVRIWVNKENYTITQGNLLERISKVLTIENIARPPQLTSQ